MCYCTPSIRTPTCGKIDCIPKVDSLQQIGITHPIIPPDLYNNSKTIDLNGQILKEAITIKVAAVEEYIGRKLTVSEYLEVQKSMGCGYGLT